MTMTTTTPEIENITREIHVLESHAVERVQSAFELKLEIGKRLQRAKGLLPHGKFLPWARKEFGWSPRHVQRHMKISANATRVSHLRPDSTLRAALAAVDEAKPAAKRSESLQFLLATDTGESIEVKFRDGSQQAGFLMQAVLGDLRLRVVGPVQGDGLREAA